MDSDPRTRKGKDGKKKDQKHKGKSQQQIGSGKGLRAKLANLERAIEKKKENITTKNKN